jgi:cytoskeletal protein RodZ
MTTTVATPEVKLDRDPLRVLSIAANLLPAEITDARREHKLRWIVAAMLVVVVVALGGWDVAARMQTSDQQATLKSTQNRVDSLAKTRLQYANLSNIKSENVTISQQLTKLMAQDVAWYKLVPTLRSTAQTAGVSLTNINAILSSATTGAAAAPATGTGTASAPGIATNQVGTITIVGVTPDKPQLAAYLQQLAAVPGLSNPFLTTLSAQGGQYQFSLTVSFTSSLFSGRYTPATTNGGK